MKGIVFIWFCLVVVYTVGYYAGRSGAAISFAWTLASIGTYAVVSLGLATLLYRLTERRDRRRQLPNDGRGME